MTDADKKAIDALNLPDHPMIVDEPPVVDNKFHNDGTANGVIHEHTGRAVILDDKRLAEVNRLISGLH